MNAFGVGDEIAKGYVGDKVVQVKAALERRKAKPKKANFALRPLKGMETLMGAAKVAKGAYSESMEGIQRDRQKANRRRAAGNAFLGGSAIAGAAAAANPEGTKNITRRAAQSLILPQWKMNDKAWGSATRNAGEAYKPPHASKVQAADTLASAGKVMAKHPGRAAAGVIGGAALAGAGLKGAGMAHNARSNRNARKYNRRKANSRIKVVPTSGKNRF